MATNCGTVTVRPAFDPSLVSTGGCSIGNQTIQPGSTITVSASVSNDNGYDDASATVALLLNGSQETTTTVTVPTGSSTDVSFDVTFPEEGDYDLDVDVVDATVA